MAQIASEIVPMKRVAEPQEVADLIIWLCSERASYINGSLSRSSNRFSMLKC